MANPTLGWDRIPFFGWWSDNPGVPSSGRIHLTVRQRIRRVDGRMIYPGGATRTVTIGALDEQDADIRTAVHDAMKARDQVAQGAQFNEAEWDARWTANLTSAIFTSFWAADDPDITPHGVDDEGYKVTVMEELLSSAGREYLVQPLIAHLDLPVPGVNLADVEVPPDAPSVSAPVLAKGQPGGIAGLDGDGDVVNAQGVKVGAVDPTQVEASVQEYLTENPVDGLPSGGTTGQLLARTGTDAAGWVDPPEGGGGGAVEYVYWTGTTWPDRPTDDPDVTVNWIGGSAALGPSDGLSGVDLWFTRGVPQ